MESRSALAAAYHVARHGRAPTRQRVIQRPKHQDPGDREQQLEEAAKKRGRKAHMRLLKQGGDE